MHLAEGASCLHRIELAYYTEGDSTDVTSYTTDRLS